MTKRNQKLDQSNAEILRLAGHTSPSMSDLHRKLTHLRKETVGRYSQISVPNLWYQKAQQRSIGETANNETVLKPLIHLDYTASAQTLQFIEAYILHCMETYANTHTESSASGRLTGQRVNEALNTIRNHVGAGKDSFVLPVGFGATGAIEKVQNILGLYLSPRAHSRIKNELRIDLREKMSERIVVFVGPSEHHSNDVSWQDDILGKFVRIKAVKSGFHRHKVDLADLELQLRKYKDYQKIASFSAASNVTGIRNDLKEIGRLLRLHNCLFLVDYAASGPYAQINMQTTGIDAIFLSAHKNLGGTNLGLLIGRNSIYDKKSHPSFGGGGTVSSVTPWTYNFHDDIQVREMAGTPGLRHILQAALSFEVKEWIGLNHIEQIDQKLCDQMIDFFESHPRLQLLGNADPQSRYPIFSFIIPYGKRYLHHNFVASLLNDAFGIQARSGCACAGPYGHELLGIDKKRSERYVGIIESDYNGFKPGWIRIGTHYTLLQEEVEFIQWALSATAWFGSLFLEDYQFNPYSGEWRHKSAFEPNEGPFGLGAALALIHTKPESESTQMDPDERLLKRLSEMKIEFCQLIAFKLLHYGKIDSLINPACKQPIASCIRHLIEGKTSDIDAFLSEILATIGPHLPKQNSDRVMSTWKNILADPEAIRNEFQTFFGIFADTCFFYAMKGSLHPALDKKEQIELKIG